MPRPLTASDLVQFLLHAGSKRVVHQVAEVLDQPVRDEFTNLLDVESTVLERDIAAILNRRNDRRIGGGPADALTLQFAYQARFAVPGRRLREMLHHARIDESQGLAFRVVRQGSVLVSARDGRQDPREAVELHDAATGAQLEIAGAHRHCRGCVLRMGHLACDELPPDEVVQALLLPRQGGRTRRAGLDGGRSNRLVRFLGGRPAPVRRRSVGQVRLAKLPADVPSRAGDRVRRQVHRVRAHIGDVPRLVQSLRHSHGPAHREAETRRRSLLQGGSDERRVGPCPGRPVLAFRNRERRPSQSSKGFVGRLSVGRPKALAAVSRDVEPMARARFRSGEIREAFPILFRRERTDVPLALHQEAHRHRLHPARRQASGHLGPEQRR